MIHCDLAVIGGGSGGFGAALAAARRGLQVLLVERGPMLGGNSTLGGVNTWEPGIGGPGFHAELYETLIQQPQAIAVSNTIKGYSQEEPWSWSKPNPDLTYRDSLRRGGLPQDRWARVTFEPDAMAEAMRSMLDATGCVDLKLNSAFVNAEVQDRRISSLTIEQEGEQIQIAPRFVVDSTANLFVARAAGCATYLGSEPQSLYGEPGAPAEHENRLNAVSLCFRVTPVSTPAVEPLPSGVSDVPFKQAIAITEYPNGDLSLNPLPIMEGMEYHRMEETERRRACEERVARLWHWLQTEHGFDRYRILNLSPFTGVREGPRLIGRHVLTEQDVRSGCSDRSRGDQWITLADHALDVHGAGQGCRELEGPYGVPYECLLPKEIDNLAVACRGASCSQIAASSCRLSRTMMQLGHAAGLAAFQTLDSGRTDLSAIDTGYLQELLRQDHVTLDPDNPAFPPAS